MNQVYVVIGEFLYEYGEVVSVHDTEQGANLAAESAKSEVGYDYVNVECLEVQSCQS